VSVLGLFQLGVRNGLPLSLYFPSSFTNLLSTCALKFGLVIVELTEPLGVPSWGDFPLTLNLRR
jgi:hypothetical protein